MVDEGNQNDHQIVFDRVKSNLPDWKDATFNKTTFKRMCGLSNFVMRVAHEGCQTVLYRVYENEHADAKLELAVFRAVSDEGIGPKLLFAGDNWRLERFFEGRPISIWEMRNPFLMNRVADLLFNFNWNQKVREEAAKIIPMNKDNLYIDMFIDDWAPSVKEQFPSMRSRLLQDNGIPHPESLKAIDTVDRHLFFNGYQKWFKDLVPRDTPIIFAHNDG